MSNVELLDSAILKYSNFESRLGLPWLSTLEISSRQQDSRRDPKWRIFAQIMPHLKVLGIECD